MCWIICHLDMKWLISGYEILVLTRGLDLFHHEYIIHVCAHAAGGLSVESATASLTGDAASVITAYSQQLPGQESACVYWHDEVISVIMEMIHPCVKFKICEYIGSYICLSEASVSDNDKGLICNPDPLPSASGWPGSFCCSSPSLSLPLSHSLTSVLSSAGMF